MDSITQATLGAVMGEAVLGKKMGNKAVLLGAVAGTIPDLDVLSRLFLDHQVYGLIYHRGITHSIAFSILAAPLFAWLASRYYEKRLDKNKMMQICWAILYGGIYLAFLTGIGAIAWFSNSIVATIIFLGLIGLGVPIFKTFNQNINFPSAQTYSVTFREWTLMYFLAFWTHWMIDACTAYGTQIFEPFSNYRVAFNNISIVDPLYTVPMLLGLTGVLLARKYKKRLQWNSFGLIVSSLYMASTFYGKSIMNSVVQQNLEEQGIAATEYITYPSIFNTMLWQTTISTADAYYYGVYSLFDAEPSIRFTKLPKNHDLIDSYKDDELVEILLWFAQGYYNVSKNEDGSLTLHNLRFGLMGVLPESDIPIEDRYIFRFNIVEKDGVVDVLEDREMDRVSPSEMATALWRRMWGDKASLK